MFSDDENEKLPSETDPGDVGETQQMDQKPASKAKKKKAADEWQTVVGTPRAPKSASPSPAPSEPAPAEPAAPTPSAPPSTPPPTPPPMPPSAERTVVEPMGGSGAGGSISAPPPPMPKPAPSAIPASEMPRPAGSMPAGSPAIEAGAPQGGLGGMLANIGIKDQNTQRIVLIGGGAVLLFCCACPCLLYVGNLALGLTASGGF